MANIIPDPAQEGPAEGPGAHQDQEPEISSAVLHELIENLGEDVLQGVLFELSNFLQVGGDTKDFDDVQKAFLKALKDVDLIRQNQASRGGVDFTNEGTRGPLLEYLSNQKQYRNRADASASVHSGASGIPLTVQERFALTLNVLVGKIQSGPGHCSDLSCYLATENSEQLYLYGYS